MGGAGGAWALVGLATADVPEAERSVASSVSEGSIHVGGALAPALLTTTLAAASDGPPGRRRPGDAGGYTAAYLVATVLVVLDAATSAALLGRGSPASRRWFGCPQEHIARHVRKLATATQGHCAHRGGRSLQVTTPAPAPAPAKQAPVTSPT